tara:strand:+ start:5465 stop:5782 length:318 start_codon:yes stop_codon:yes gene_type:complete
MTTGMVVFKGIPNDIPIAIEARERDLLLLGDITRPATHTAVARPDTPALILVAMGAITLFTHFGAEFVVAITIALTVFVVIFVVAVTVFFVIFTTTPARTCGTTV